MDPAVSNSRILILPNSRIRIRIRLESRVRIRIKVKSRIRIRIKRVWIRNTRCLLNPYVKEGVRTLQH
jgi:hypothetical protein